MFLVLFLKTELNLYFCFHCLYLVFYFCRKWSSSSAPNTSSGSSIQTVLATPPVVAPAPESPPMEVSSQSNEAGDGEWTYDPNEPRYCLCNQVSYGDMVACDNEDVSEFFILIYTGLHASCITFLSKLSTWFFFHLSMRHILTIFLFIYRMSQNKNTTKFCFLNENPPFLYLPLNCRYSTN